MIELSKPCKFVEWPRKAVAEATFDYFERNFPKSGYNANKDLIFSAIYFHMKQ